MTKRIYLGQVSGFLLTVCCAAQGQTTDQASAEGFIEGSSLRLVARNHYWHQTADSVSPQRDWGQSLLAYYESGITQGPIGVGANLFAFGAVKLDGGSGRAGSPNIPYDGNGDPKRNFSKGGGSVRLRALNTTLQIGDQFPAVPVFSLTTDVYLLPQVATGWSISSTDFSLITLNAGHFTSSSNTLSTSHQGDLYASYAGITGRAISYAGATYNPNDRLTLSAYAGRFEDLWDQYYYNAGYTYPISDTQSLNLDFNLYHTQEAGSARLGNIDVNAYSLALTYTIQSHSIKAAFQNIDGDQPFDYISLGGTEPGIYGGGFTKSIYLANASVYNDFNASNERSFMLDYTYDAADLGLPGLTLWARHVRGYNIDGSHLGEDSAYVGIYGDNGSEHESDFGVFYTVQGGSAKGLTAQLYQALYSGPAGNLNQTRINLSYPIDIF